MDSKPWNRNARHWRMPNIDGSNMNRWTPLDAYRPYLTVVVALIAAIAFWFIYPELGNAALFAALSFGAGVQYADKEFWEFRTSLYDHLDDKYGPSWQKIDDAED